MIRRSGRSGTVLAERGGGSETLVGDSEAFRAVLRKVDMVAPTDASVLLEGESGTGKELVARELHRRSPRRRAPFVRVNCAAVPEQLYESEFFGHVRGAFTGATSDREGRFARADGGTLLLDEVGEIPPPLQGKLLRVLQEGEFEPVGGTATRRVDVRVLATTNRCLRSEVEAGRFREDLFYRLAVFPLVLPPLRERRDDILPLARHHLRRATRRLGRPGLVLTPEQEERLVEHDWPGNVRELRNVMERGAILGRGGRPGIELDASGATAAARFPARDIVLTEREMEARVRANLEAALRRSRGKIYGPGGAAELLGVRPTTLASRLDRMGISRDVWRDGV